MVLFVSLSAITGAAADRVGDSSAIQYHGVERHSLVYRPEGLAEAPPVLVLLHGSGRDGASVLKPWLKIADAEGILLVAPEAADPAEWSPYDDDPGYFAAVLDAVAAEWPFDPDRVLLFGHSAGAVWALQLALLDSERYAAVAVHAGLIPPGAESLVAQAKRRVPIQIQIGTRDPFFPLNPVRATRDLLTEHGFAVELLEIPHHDHDYYRRAKKVNAAAWEFFERAVGSAARDVE